MAFYGEKGKRELAVIKKEKYENRYNDG